MSIKLSDSFSYRKLIRFTLPSIAMMIFTSIYGMVDGLFVSNFAGKVAFASVNLIMPFVMMLSGVGFIFGTGGSALVAKIMGEGDNEKANRTFSLLIYIVIVLGVIFMVAGIVFMRTVSIVLGADEQMLDNCVTYGRIVMISTVPFLLQTAFQSFMVAAEKPQMGLIVTVTAGVSNMVLDALFVGVFGWGIQGAAWATVITEALGGFIPLVYFMRPNSSRLRLCRTSWEGGAVRQACWNGSSEFVSNISMSVVNACYNLQLMKYAGSDGVAAYGTIMYVNFIFIAIFLGYSVGSAPIVSFNYGAENDRELQNMFSKSLKLILVASILMVIAAEALARPLSSIFVGYDAGLLAMTARAFRIYALTYMVAGFNIYGSGFFTALNNGTVSAVISFLRTLVFQISAVFLLPLILGIDGIWIAIIVAEILALIVTAAFLVKLRPRYHYY